MIKKKKHIKMIKKKDLIKMINKLDVGRKKAMKEGRWVYPLPDDWKEKTLQNLDTALSFINGETVHGMLPPNTSLVLGFGRIAPSAELYPGKLIINPYYILAAAGTLLPDKDLKFNLDSLLLTIAHERNHWKTHTSEIAKYNIMNQKNVQFARYCEEVRSDLLGIRDFKTLAGVTDDYCKELMTTREGFDEEPSKDGEEHPSRTFRAELSTYEWNRDTIKKIYDYLKNIEPSSKKTGSLEDKYVDKLTKTFSSFKEKEEQIKIKDSLRHTYEKEVLTNEKGK